MTCGLCDCHFVTHAHILRGCPWVYRKEVFGFEHRYTWCHNSIVVLAVNAIPKFLKKSRTIAISSKLSTLRFFKADGTSGSTAYKHTLGFLHMSKDWGVDADLPELDTKVNSFVLPQHAILTSLKNGIFLISQELNVILLVEVSCMNDNYILK